MDLNVLPEPSAGRASGRAWHSIRETGRKLAAHVRLRSSPFPGACRPFATGNGHSATFAKLNHEIRTPLNAIIGFSEFFLHQRRLGPNEARALVENVLASGQRLLSIIEAILDPFHQGIDPAALDKQPLNLRAYLSDAFGFLERQIKRSGSTCILLAQADLFVEADPAALRHMLMGLLSGTLRHAGPETLILLSVQPEKANAVVELRCKELEGFGDECDRAHLALINALALAHGGRLTIDRLDAATTMFRLTFFATSAVQ